MTLSTSFNAQRRVWLGAAALAGLLAVGACSQETADRPPEDNDIDMQPDRETQDGETQDRHMQDRPRPGGDEIELGRLTEADMTGASLEGELGCSFHAGGAYLPVFIAAANVVPDGVADGLVKDGPMTARVRSTSQGGFNALVDGGRFEGEGVVVEVEVTGQPESGGHESPPIPARISIEGHDGRNVDADGEWRCGP